MLKRTFVLCIALVMAFSAKVCAESGFVYSASSTTLVGGLTNGLGSIMILNSDVVLSTTSGSYAIVYQDGTRQSHYHKAVTTSTSVGTYSTTATAPGVCVTGSTVTFTLPEASRLQISVTGSWLHSGNDVNSFMCVMIDGAAVPPYGPGDAMALDALHSLRSRSMSGSFVTRNEYSAGVHRACITTWTTSGTMSINANGVLTLSVAEVR
jgi:hypothetical protein